MKTSPMNSAVQAELAIIDANILSAVGLQQILQSVMPRAVVRIFSSFQAFVDDTPDMYFHYFVSGQIFIEHSSFFLDRQRKVIVLTNGVANTPGWKGVKTLNVVQSYDALLKDLAMMYRHAHTQKQGAERQSPELMPVRQLLSLREIEVLTLIVKGQTNKEVADKLNVSLTTIISHRKNITEKLGIKSVSGLTIFAVTNGLVEPDDIG
jgi:DNA-binding CsgD family transcriptional regulator